MFALLPVLAFAVGDGMRVTAQDAPAVLAGALADADSVDWVRADRDHRTITFGVDRAGEAYRFVVTTTDGAVTALAIRDVGRGSFAIGRLSWLVDEMTDVDAIARLEVDRAGRVTIVTSDERRYAVVPGRGDGNDGPRARWAAAWS